MARWTLEFSTDAEKDLAQLDRSLRRRIIDKLDWFLEHFEEIFPLPLTGEFKDFYKLRIGDRRIKYRIDWQRYLISVEYIEHRSRAYKKRR